MSEIFTSISSLATYVNNQEIFLKRMISKQMTYKYDSDELFSSSEGESEGANCNNGSLVCGRLNSTKRGRNK